VDLREARTRVPSCPWQVGVAAAEVFTALLRALPVTPVSLQRSAA